MDDFRKRFVENQIEQVLMQFMRSFEKTIDHEEAAFYFANVLANMLAAHLEALKGMLNEDIVQDAFRQTIDVLLEKYDLKTQPKISFS